MNSLLTSQALHAHPLANPVVPLTANGVAAAHAAAEVLHIDEVRDTLTVSSDNLATIYLFSDHE